MKATIIITLLGGLAITPVAVFGSMALTAPDGRSRDKSNVSYHEKSQSRIAALVSDDWVGSLARIEQMQMMPPPPRGNRPFGGPLGPGMPAFELEPPRGPMARAPFGPPLPPRPPLAPRAACEGEIDLLMAHVGYLKSKMRLQGDQKASWHKLEQTAEPSLEKLRDLCAQLPSRPTQPPATLEALDFIEKQMTTRLDLLRAVRGPMQELYDTLSPDQRTLLAPPLPPPVHFLEEDNL